MDKPRLRISVLIYLSNYTQTIRSLLKLNNVLIIFIRFSHPLELGSHILQFRFLSIVYIDKDLYRFGITEIDYNE